MNNFRFSTYKGVVKDLSTEERAKLINARRTTEDGIWGRVWDIQDTHMVYGQKYTSIVYEIIIDGEVVLTTDRNVVLSTIGLPPSSKLVYLLALNEVHPYKLITSVYLGSATLHEKYTVNRVYVLFLPINSKKVI